MDPLAIAEALLAQPTAPYHEGMAAQHCLDFAAERGIAGERDAAGNVLLRSGPTDADRPLVLVAHLDHPGFSVDLVDGDVATMTFHGGVGAGNAGGGDPVDFFRPDQREPIGRGTLVAPEEAAGRLTGAVAEVLEGEVSTGGFAMWGFPSWSVEDGRITARVCDDLLGVAAILACLDQVAGTGASVWGLLTRAEEVGFLGALEAIRLGTVPAASSVLSLECSKALPDAPQGGGVIVRVGDRMSIFAPALTESLRVAAEQVGNRDESFRFQRKLMDGGACEATAFCASGYRASGLAVPLGNYHNVADDGPGIAPETVLVDDWLAEVQLLVELSGNPGLLDEASPEPPQWLQERAAVARASLGAGVVPEAPQMQALAERVADAATGRMLAKVDALQFSAIKTFDPDPMSLRGRTLEGTGRRGKYLVLGFGEGLRVLIHLSQGGRVDIEDQPKATKPKGAVVRFTFDDGPGILVKEFGTERKAGWWVLGPGDDGPLTVLGPEAQSDAFAELVRTSDDRRRVHTILRDQRTVAGVGRGYTDDILHRARLSPYASLAALQPEERERLLVALHEVLDAGLEKERLRTGGLPNKLGDGWIVHKASGQPCPACGDTLRRVSYESHEVVYCPACQTGGKVLADRRLSRLLK